MLWLRPALINTFLCSVGQMTICDVKGVFVVTRGVTILQKRTNNSTWLLWWWHIYSSKFFFNKLIHIVSACDITAGKKCSVVFEVLFFSLNTRRTLQAGTGGEEKKKNNYW